MENIRLNHFTHTCQLCTGQWGPGGASTKGWCAGDQGTMAWCDSTLYPRELSELLFDHLGMGQNPVPLVNIPKMNTILFIGMFTYPILMVIVLTHGHLTIGTRWKNYDQSDLQSHWESVRSLSLASQSPGPLRFLAYIDLVISYPWSLDLLKTKVWLDPCSEYSVIFGFRSWYMYIYYIYT